jgi:2-hydroxychromene-2-carboxylate isomerase
MKQITFYLDFISPYAHLAFEELPQALMGLSYSVSYKPVALGVLLRHHGSLGPAEIPAKRDWTYRHVMWLAHSRGLTLDMPAAHPFNPMPLLRLAVGTDEKGLPNRYVCETLFHHVWQGGADAVDAARLQAITAELAPARAATDDAVKAQLKAHTEDAIALDIFGVPAFEVDGKVFWGLDALPMLRAYLEGDAWFTDAHWNAPKELPSGLTPKKP